MMKLEWDSAFFGLNVYRIDYNKEVNITYSNGLTYLFSSESINKLSNSLQDVKITFKRPVKFNNKICIENIETYNLNYVENELRDLAIQSGHFSRFKKDKKIPLFKYEELYNLWIQNSVSKKIADETFIILINNKIAGFITVKIIKQICKIGLIAVNKKYRGLGFGKKLMSNVEKWALDNYCDTIEVETQLDNNVAYQFYKSIGFKESKREYIYHIWN